MAGLASTSSDRADQAAGGCFHLTIPTRFAVDRDERALSIGSGRWTSRGYATCLTVDDFADLRSDAAHYADARAIDAPNGLRLSAQATLRAIAKAEAR